MSKFLIIFLMILSNVFFLFSQDDMIDDLEFEEIPVVEERPAYFAIGAGYVGNFYLLNFDEINNKLSDDFDLPGYSGTMFVSGAHGFTGVGIIANLRLGFFGSGGSMQVSQNHDSVLNGSKLSASVTGITVDYGFVLFNHFAILPGIQGGWSSLNLSIYNTKKTDNEPNWNDINSNGDGTYYSKNMEGSFWFVQPGLQIEYALTPFLMARGSVGYQFSFLPTWKYNTEADLEGVPSSISTSGMNFGFGVCVGLFNF